MTDHDLAVVHESPRLVVVEKPSGLRSVPGAAEAPSVASLIRGRFPEATGPLIVHRLDMATSGLMVLALDPDAHSLLSLQFRRHRVSKRYQALVAGRPEAHSGRVSLPIRPDPTDRPRQVIDREAPKAITDWRVIESSTDGPTRLDLTPLTGKTHQLRIHLAEGLGCPIIGDDLYDGAAATRLMLHACELEFTDPDSLRRTRVVSACPF